VTLFAALVLVCLSLFAIGYPLFSRRSGMIPSGETDSAAELEERYRSALADLQDLETDHEIGNLSEADYAELRDQHRLRAASALRAIDVQRIKHEELREQIQQEIARRATGQVNAVLRTPVANGKVKATSTGSDAATRPAHVGVTSQPLPKRVFAVAGGGAIAAVIGIAALYAHILQLQAAQAPLATLAIQHAHVVLIDEDRTFWVGHHDGLLRSRNGRDWQPAGVAGDVMSITTAPSASRRLVFGHDVLLGSDADGTRWSRLDNDLPGTDIHGAGSGVNGLYAYVIGFGTFVSVDGSRWERTGPQVSSGVTSLAVLPGRGGDLLLLAADGGVLRSGDGGRTWGTAAGAGNLALSGTVRGVTADATTGALFAATSEGLFRSLSSAADWTRLPFKGGLTSVGAKGDLIAVVDDQNGFFVSTDGGGTWTADR
jgi:hypothetical protein